MSRIILGALLIVLSGCAAPCDTTSPDLGVIPQPFILERGRGFFRVTDGTMIVSDSDPDIERIALELANRLEVATGYDISVAPASGEGSPPAIVLALAEDTDDLGIEGYKLTVETDQVRLEAAGAEGLFRGVQTIRQLLPPELEQQGGSHEVDWTIPCVAIADRPRFGWRGLLLDCGRHFMSPDYVKRMIDLLAYHKMNRLHWHLTEDQGWRIEIKKYPELTRKGAWRRYDDGSVYGGFYTQDEIREIVAYAEERYVTIVPEIEMPGHSVAALASYPEISCTGGPFEVETQWGVHKDVYCAGNEKTFAFLEDVLAEVIDLFPSTYIHIGGDECPKDRWSKCEKCQARIAKEGLDDEHELQSWFIQRIEKFLISKGRRLIGWDEILEGGLAPEATVQSWRGMDGAIKAAKSGHDAIVSPTSHAYFDYDIGTTDLRKVFSFEPIPPGLTRDEQRRILGGECNMWTERAPQETVDSKVFPRILAMCEVLWSDRSWRNYSEFLRRVKLHYRRLDYLGVDYGPAACPIAIVPSFDFETRCFEVVLESGELDAEIRYTLDGASPTQESARYEHPLELGTTTEIRARAFLDGAPYGGEAVRRLVLHRAAGKPIALAHAYSPKYTGGGDQALVDGLTGSPDFGGGYWQAFLHDDLDATIDLTVAQPVNTVTARFLQSSPSWIFLPTRVDCALSTDGKEFETVATLTHDVSQKKPSALIREFVFSCKGARARFVRIRAQSVKVCPAWHPGAGGEAWIFADEIIVE